jgi:hypothetical protein
MDKPIDLIILIFSTMIVIFLYNYDQAQEQEDKLGCGHLGYDAMGH